MTTTDDLKNLLKEAGDVLTRNQEGLVDLGVLSERLRVVVEVTDVLVPKIRKALAK